MLYVNISYTQFYIRTCISNLDSCRTELILGSAEYFSKYFQLSSNERLYLHAARMGDMLLLNDVMTSSLDLDYDCIDYMGRNALHLAVDSESFDMIETLIEKVAFENIEEALLHAISKGKT